MEVAFLGYPQILPITTLIYMNHPMIKTWPVQQQYEMARV